MGGPDETGPTDFDFRHPAVTAGHSRPKEPGPASEFRRNIAAGSAST